MKLTITKEFSFGASHRLIDLNTSEEENKKIFGKCYNFPSHGHTYKLFVTVSNKNQKLEHGMIINFTKLKEIVQKNVLELFDHHYINDVKCMRNKITTCEEQIKVIWDLLSSDLYKENCILEELKLYETPTSCATLTNRNNSAKFREITSTEILEMIREQKRICTSASTYYYLDDLENIIFQDIKPTHRQISTLFKIAKENNDWQKGKFAYEELEDDSI